MFVSWNWTSNAYAMSIISALVTNALFGLATIVLERISNVGKRLSLRDDAEDKPVSLGVDVQLRSKGSIPRCVAVSSEFCASLDHIQAD